MPQTTMQMLEEAFHGSITGVVIVLVGHPFDTLKTRKQINHFRYPEMIRSMIYKEGLKSFYKGMLSPLVSVPLFKAVLFSSYKTTLNRLNSDSAWDNYHGMKITVSAMIGGFANAFIAGPTELFKTKLQIQRGLRTKVYNGNLDCFRKIYKVSGWRCLFQGTHVAIYRDMIAYWLQFYYYDKICRYFGNGDINSVSNFQKFIAGGISGMLCWIGCYPLDLVKSRRQAQVLTEAPKIFDNFYILRDLKKILKKDGIQKMFSGVTIISGRSFFAHGLGFCIWGFLQQNYKYY